MQGGGLIWILMRTLTNKMDETMEKFELWLCILILDMIIAEWLDKEEKVLYVLEIHN